MAINNVPKQQDQPRYHCYHSSYHMHVSYHSVRLSTCMFQWGKTTTVIDWWVSSE